MRAKLILILILLIFVSCDNAMSDNTPLRSAETNKQITQWLDKTYGFSRIKEIKHDGKEILIAFGDSAFGVSNLVIYVYVHEKDKWHLCLIRYTNTSKVDVSVEDDNLVLKSKSGNIILIQPMKTLTSEFDNEEQ
jgi:hypothetical protein